MEREDVCQQFAPRRKRVAAACDCCRKKRLKCTWNQRPCMNCQLYGEECKHTKEPKPRPGLRSNVKERHKKQTSTSTESAATTTPLRSSVTFHRTTALNTHNASHSRQLSLLHPESSKLPYSDDHITPLSVIELENFPSDLTQPCGFRDSAVPLHGTFSDNTLDMSHFLGGFQTGIDGDALELPARHENGELNNPQQHAFIGKLGGKVSGVQYLNRNHQSEPSQRLILPGLFIREDAVSSYFIGLNSTGALLAASIQQSRQSSAASTNIPSLDYLIESGSRLDETAALLKVNISNFKPSPKSLAAAAIKTYFSNVYSFYPVVDVVLFQSDWEAIYSQPLEEQSILEYMTLYLIIAIGAVCNPATKEVITELQTISDNLYQQAWDLLNDSITKLSVTSVQILLLHVIFLMYRGRGGMAWVLCGLAIRISQAIGLHRRSPRDIDLTEAEIHLRSQLWWSAFCLDAELSLALGRPTALPDSDHDAELFPLDLPDQTLPNKTAITANIYCWKVTLARIQNRFCCVLNRDDSMGSMVEALVRLDSALMKWRDEIPLEYRPQQEILAQDDTYHLVALLHLEYYNMVRALHWALITAVPAKGDMMEDSSNPRIYARETICLSAARSFVKTLNDIIDSEGQIYVFVMSLHVDRYIAALAVLYRSIFRNPGRISVKTDLEYFRAGKIHLERRILGRSVNWGLRNFIDAMLKSAEDLVLQSDRA